MSQSLSQDDKVFSVYGAMKLSDALDIVQRALVQINAQLTHPDLQSISVELESADLNLETMLGAEVGVEATVAVVTVTGSVAGKVTHTLAISLRPQTPPSTDVIKLIDPTTQLVTLTSGMFEVLLAAMSADGIPLELKSGSVSIELVVDANGKLEVAPAGFWKKVAEFFGVSAKASVSAEYVSTSSITLNFKSTKDDAA